MPRTRERMLEGFDCEYSAVCDKCSIGGGDRCDFKFGHVWGES